MLRLIDYRKLTRIRSTARGEKEVLVPTDNNSTTYAISKNDRGMELRQLQDDLEHREIVDACSS